MDYFAQFLASRNLTDDDLKKMFSFERLVISGTDEICTKLHSLDRNTRINCLSDYDSDGFWSAVIDYIGLHILGFNHVTIAHRDISKGYAFDKNDIDAIGDVDVIITTDVGIACCDAIDYAKSKGIYVIVTDHHVPTTKGKPNNADIIVDYLFDKRYVSSNIEVCGAYTIYQVYERYVELYGDEFENLAHVKSDLEKLRHLAAIATVSDSMPLLGLNHYIVAEMLHFFNYINPMSLSEGSNESDDIVKGVCYDSVLQNVYNNVHTFITMCADSYYTGFDMKFLEYSVNPVVNTIKRMSEDISLFYNMVFGTSEDALEAAGILIELNNERKAITASLYDEMFVQHLNQRYDGLIYMVKAPSGILGLLAAKVHNQTKLPVVVLSNEMRYDANLNSYVYDGSIRSPKWYPFLSRVTASGIATCAGHEYACAITVPIDKCDDLYQFLFDDIEKYGIIANKPVTKEEVIKDYEVCLDYDDNFITFLEDVEKFMEDMHNIAPFGAGFPEPSIMLKFNKSNGAVSLLKEGQHTKIKVTPGFEALLWNVSYEQVEASTIDDIVYLKGYLAVSYFQGKRTVNFIATPALSGDEV